MKRIFLFAALVGLMATACATNEKSVADMVDDLEAVKAPAEKTAQDYVPSKSLRDSVSYLMGINFGSFIKGYDFGELNYTEIRKGIVDFLNAEGRQDDPAFVDQFKVNPMLMNEMFNEYLEMRHNFIRLSNKEAEEKFLAANLRKPGVETTPSGLQYKVIEPGNDVRATLSDTVYVNYKGTLLDGTVFDETEEGAEPVKMMLTHVIPGWQEGLALVGEGSHVILYVPANLAYGEMGRRGSIQPNSTLIFDITVSKIGKKVEE